MSNVTLTARWIPSCVAAPPPQHPFIFRSSPLSTADHPLTHSLPPYLRIPPTPPTTGYSDRRRPPHPTPRHFLTPPDALQPRPSLLLATSALSRPSPVDGAARTQRPFPRSPHMHAHRSHASTCISIRAHSPARQQPSPEGCALVGHVRCDLRGYTVALVAAHPSLRPQS